MPTKKKDAPSLLYFYLFNGYLTYDKNGNLVLDKEGKPMPVDGSVDTIRDTIVITKEKPVKGSNETVPWVTNVNGVFHKINRESCSFGERAAPVHRIKGKEIRQFLIPRMGSLKNKFTLYTSRIQATFTRYSITKARNSVLFLRLCSIRSCKINLNPCV